MATLPKVTDYQQYRHAHSEPCDWTQYCVTCWHRTIHVTITTVCYDVIHYYVKCHTLM